MQLYGGLAWLFWHTPHELVPRDEYHEAMAAFHRAVRRIAPPGFCGVRVLEYESTPWLPSAREVYENWYFVEDSAALDHLDRAAISADAEIEHRRIAALTSAAAAGLYRLRAGTPAAQPSRCTWLNKPRSKPYDPFIKGLSASGAVWTRQMVLGPTPEFCLEGCIPETADFAAQGITVLRPRFASR